MSDNPNWSNSCKNLLDWGAPYVTTTQDFFSQVVLLVSLVKINCTIFGYLWCFAPLRNFSHRFKRPKVQTSQLMVKNLPAQIILSKGGGRWILVKLSKSISVKIISNDIVQYGPHYSTHISYTCVAMPTCVIKS